MKKKEKIVYKKYHYLIILFSDGFVSGDDVSHDLDDSHFF